MKIRIIYKKNRHIMQQEFTNVEDIKVYEDKIVIYHKMPDSHKKMDIKDYTVIPKKKIGIVELDFMKRDQFAANLLR